LEVVCVLGCGTSTGIGAVLNTAGLRAGESIAIYGCGGVGLGAVMAAKLAGAGMAIAIDKVDRKLKMAKELGADYVINASQENPQERIASLTGKDVLTPLQAGADYALECIGNAEVMMQAFASIHIGGKCVVMGMAPLGAMLNIAPWEFNLGKTITGSTQGDIKPLVDVPRYVDLYMNGKLPIDKLISKSYRLDQINEAYGALERGEIIRGVVRF
jgi:S-(hydroxymethyl)glutathione dehydrogenase/alcohol dehydrogenase